jgi:Raf kinase inhibitor-like YbhB/YbcL family protein
MQKANVIFFLLLVLFLSCQNKDSGTPQKEKNTNKEERKISEMKLTSSAFVEGGIIPFKYTCDGQNISPQLFWTGVPAGTVSIALLCDDPDAPVGDWVHWIIYNIPPYSGELKENIPEGKVLDSGIKQGINDFRKNGYGGPCPPGDMHRYFFKLYALDIMLEPDPGMNKAMLLKAINAHILGEAQLMGKYKRVN